MLSELDFSPSEAHAGFMKVLNRHLSVATIDAQGCITYANDHFCEISGYPRAELLGQHHNALSSGIHPSDFFKSMYEMALAGDVWQGDICNRAKNGLIYWLQTTIAAIWDADGILTMLVAIGTDVTAQKKKYEQLELLQVCIERTNDVIVITEAEPIDLPGPRIVYANQAFETLTGYSREEVIGKTPRILQGPESDRAPRDRIRTALSQWKSIREEILNYTKDGQKFWAELEISPIANEAGWFTHWIAVQRDITQRKANEEQALKLAFYDSLTGMANRRLLIDRLTQAIASASRTGLAGALLFVDLDFFKTINDTLGQNAGDKILKLVAQRLNSCVREGYTTARLGGDDFVIMLEDLSVDATQAALSVEELGNKISAAFMPPYQIDGKDYWISASLGATLFGPDRPLVDDLLKQAEIAMYAAKVAGRDILRFFDPRMQQAIDARVAMQDGLGLALKRREFQLHYQIQVDRAGKAVGAEGLIRWSRPGLGLVPPGQFIPLAEETGLIIPIGLWVLETACAQIKIWQQHEATRHLTLSVNVSVIQFQAPDFVELIRAVVTRHGIEPTRLMLELTESIMVKNVTETISKISELKTLGISTSLDDFGTGYSSLQYLKKLPLAQLKIDQSFVHGMLDDDREKSIVHTIVVLAQSMGMDVIAEGVETQEQYQLLLTEGCVKFQGYLFGRPQPLGQFEQNLRQG